MSDFDPLAMDDQDEQNEAASKAAEDRRKELVSDFLWLMGDRRGRRIVWRMLSEAGVFRSSFSPEALTIAFNEGRRDSGLKLLAQTNELCPDLYTTMMKEQLK